MTGAVAPVSAVPDSVLPFAAPREPFRDRAPGAGA
ncbi:hypothetical protein JOF36_004399 [Pseudonocardia parietis]|uniref:Uncharacterized protein n=1 Tax=Pseudonocardia parietis TaxID=570936 RepID=A0ABS4VXT3_9PSEU|nr:hypothetical protein [Pseudonocardia parietis]